jgi:hypothetical protein
MVFDLFNSKREYLVQESGLPHPDYERELRQLVMEIALSKNFQKCMVIF